MHGGIYRCTGIYFFKSAYRTILLQYTGTPCPRTVTGFCRCFAFQIGKIRGHNGIIRNFQFRKFLPVKSNVNLSQRRCATRPAAFTKRCGRPTHRSAALLYSSFNFINPIPAFHPFTLRIPAAIAFPDFLSNSRISAPAMSTPVSSPSLKVTPPKITPVRRYFPIFNFTVDSIPVGIAP